MAITFDEKFEKESYGLIKSGNYDVVVEKVEVKTSSKGNKFLSLTYKIRSDVEQDFKGRNIWDVLFLDTNEQYAKEGWFDTRKFFNIIKTQPNYQRDFNNPEEAIFYLKGLKFVIGIETIMDDSTGAEKNQVIKNSYKQSTHLDAKANTQNNTPKHTNDSLELDDTLSSLPF